MNGERVGKRGDVPTCAINLKSGGRLVKSAATRRSNGRDGLGQGVKKTAGVHSLRNDGEHGGVDVLNGCGATRHFFAVDNVENAAAVAIAHQGQKEEC